MLPTEIVLRFRRTDSFKKEAAPREAHPLGEEPGTPRNRTREFRLQLVRGGSILENQIGRKPPVLVLIVPFGALNKSTSPRFSSICFNRSSSTRIICPIPDAHKEIRAYCSD